MSRIEGDSAKQAFVQYGPMYAAVDIYDVEDGVVKAKRSRVIQRHNTRQASIGNTLVWPSFKRICGIRTGQQHL